MVLLSRTEHTIGRGSHWDKIAQEAIERKDQVQNSGNFVAECGLGASGFPHIGSFADAARANVIKVAVEDTGIYETAFYAYSDDLDGLRKVPAGLPSSLKEWIGTPVTRIPDPDGCHESYGEHMTSLLLGSLDRANIEYHHKSAAVLYNSGSFTEQISTILENHRRAGQIIEEVTGQDKYLETIPYHPICKHCGKIYTTSVTQVNVPEHQISYICQDTKIGGNSIPGCGHEGVVDYRKAEGKLSWKVEFASRWNALQVDFEPYGKDIIESVMTNNRISKEILEYEPPYQVRYEMFLDKGGSKISKSKGNVFTPSMWFEYGSPQSLVLMTLKRFEGTRTLTIDDIPGYMDELADLEALYFGLKKEKDQKKLQQARALYEYCYWLDPPDHHSLSVDTGRYKAVPYQLLVHLHKFVPDDSKWDEFVRQQLDDYELIGSGDDFTRLQELMRYTNNWVEQNIDDDPDEPVHIQLGSQEQQYLESLVDRIQSMPADLFVADEIQRVVFETIKEKGLQMRSIFGLLYQIFLGIPSGPRIGKIMALMGKQTTMQKIQDLLD